MASIKNMKPRELHAQEFSSAQIQEFKNLVDNHVATIEKELGYVPSFDNFIEDRIKRTTLDVTLEKFNAYKKMWELSGRNLSSADEVYSKYFSSSSKPQKLQTKVEKANILKMDGCKKCNREFSSSSTGLCIACKRKEENANDFLYAFGFIFALGFIGIGGILRYVINPRIPTWLILTVFFFGFILVRRYYRFKE